MRAPDAVVSADDAIEGNVRLAPDTTWWFNGRAVRHNRRTGALNSVFLKLANLLNELE